jgi:hypothetical protein
VNPKIEQATHDRSAAYYGLCDKVITVSSGLLAITITFRGSLLSAAGPTVRSPHLLIVTWVALAVTVAAGLLTHLGQVQAQTQAIRMMIAHGIGAGQPNLFFRVCSWIMALSFAVALASFVLFAIRNTPH